MRESKYMRVSESKSWKKIGQATQVQFPYPRSEITKLVDEESTKTENLPSSPCGKLGNESAGFEGKEKEILSFRVRSLRGCTCSVTYQPEATVEETFPQLSGNFELRMIGILCQGKRIPKYMRVSKEVAEFRGTWVTTLDPHCQ